MKKEGSQSSRTMAISFPIFMWLAKLSPGFARHKDKTGKEMGFVVRLFSCWFWQGHGKNNPKPTKTNDKMTTNHHQPQPETTPGRLMMSCARSM